jgi:hypothetical protein
MRITGQHQAMGKTKRLGAAQDIRKTALGERNSMVLYVRGRIGVAVFLVTLIAAAACGGGISLLDEPFDTLTISLDRGPCFGFCPDYNVTIRGDGTVVFDGRNFVQTRKTVTASVPVEEVERLVAAFDDADFFGLEEEYAVGATDLPTIITSISIGGRTKRILHYGVGCGTDDPSLDNAPEELCQIEELIDEVAGTEPWVRGSQ